MSDINVGRNCAASVHVLCNLRKPVNQFKLFVLVKVVHTQKKSQKLICNSGDDDEHNAKQSMVNHTVVGHSSVHGRVSQVAPMMI